MSVFVLMLIYKLNEYFRIAKVFESKCVLLAYDLVITNKSGLFRTHQLNIFKENIAQLNLMTSDTLGYFLS